MEELKTSEENLLSNILNRNDNYIKTFTNLSLNSQKSPKNSIKLMSILLIDDDYFCLEILKDQIISFGFSIETAINGLEAMDIIKKKKFDFDLIISDIDMPLMDGYEFCHQFREYSKRECLKKIPILGLTGNEINYNIINEFDFLEHKPITISKLAKRIKELVIIKNKKIESLIDSQI